MKKRRYPPEFMNRLGAVRGKRSRIVVEHILKHGQITSEELQRDYGYEHPPRAVRDVREQGIPIETFQVRNAEGKSIAAYRFGDPSEIRDDRFAGRTALPKSLKEQIIEADGPACAVCLVEFDSRYLQIDHRVPYEVAGEEQKDPLEPSDFMLLCGSCNRAKSWSCEHCPNLLEERNRKVCLTCYWASPKAYKHVALRGIRRLEVVWTEKEVEVFQRIQRKVEASHTAMPNYVKAVIERHVTE